MDMAVYCAAMSSLLAGVSGTKLGTWIWLFTVQLCPLCWLECREHSLIPGYGCVLCSYVLSAGWCVRHKAWHLDMAVYWAAMSSLLAGVSGTQLGTWIWLCTVKLCLLCWLVCQAQSLIPGYGCVLCSYVLSAGWCVTNIA
jgi:hypothetical protein